MAGLFRQPGFPPKFRQASSFATQSTQCTVLSRLPNKTKFLIPTRYIFLVLQRATRELRGLNECFHISEVTSRRRSASCNEVYGRRDPIFSYFFSTPHDWTLPCDLHFNPRNTQSCPSSPTKPLPTLPQKRSFHPLDN